MTALLDVKGLDKHFGALHVTRNVTFQLQAGARQALIGPNGAGKTTLINLITGFLKPDSGRVLLDGENITSLRQAARVKRGVARTFQINQLFKPLTVLENVVLSVAEAKGVAGSLLSKASADSAVVDEAYGLLEQLQIQQDALKLVSELPYGRQRLVEIAITLGQKPKVLLLDEPAAGVPSTESHIILDVLDRLPKELAILLIEHDMEVVFRFAKGVTVLVDGGVFAEGEPNVIAEDPKVRAVYLGESVHV